MVIAVVIAVGSTIQRGLPGLPAWRKKSTSKAGRSDDAMKQTLDGSEPGTPPLWPPHPRRTRREKEVLSPEKTTIESRNPSIRRLNLLLTALAARDVWVLLGIATATSLRGGNDEYRLLTANLLSMTCSYRRRIRYYEFAEKPLEAATGFPRRLTFADSRMWPVAGL